MGKLFFQTSGEHETLPVSEAEAILKAEGYRYQIKEKLTQVLRLEAETNCIDSIKARSALTRVCCQEIFNCNASTEKILDNIQSFVDEFIGNETFAVRIRRVKGVNPEIDRVWLEGHVGATILEKVTTSKVNLTNPQKTFYGVLTDNKFIFGLKLAEITPKPFSDRRPRRRPFFHPTAMQAKLARAMVNLAQPKTGDLILDPFCGTGGMLIEAGLIGCRVIGFDAKPHMLRGGRKNIKHFGIEAEGFAIADARCPPITKVNCIVTDPPYGRSASTLGAKTRYIVEDFLAGIGNSLPKGAKICMAAPKKIQISETAQAAGFKHLESHFVYVHRSLTREIVVFEKL
ncbi:MAG: N-6 DNA methylase [Candidatus Bathyarchaeota archaeon]|nr:DNA methyltransferase [Candidatus Bathyarchaeum tardum]WGM89784.1 MAG: DNA methyltransferase [Candidatus Bathyarchaeum tardum]WNZ30118.1 MAG: N-6 DNA methylase [Candidatus Bathyarchaeota archaeon]